MSDNRFGGVARRAVACAALAAALALAACGGGQGVATDAPSADAQRNGAGTIPASLPADADGGGTASDPGNAGGGTGAAGISGGGDPGAVDGASPVGTGAASGSGQPGEASGISLGGIGAASSSGASISAAPPVAQGLLDVGEKMFVGQMNDIYANTADYLGRAIRYEGYFTFFDNEQTGDRYNMVVRNGPGCCGYDSLVGFEVDWGGAMPEKDAWCVVQGTVDTYKEGGGSYIIVRADTLETLPYRGNDTVTQ